MKVARRDERLLIGQAGLVFSPAQVRTQLAATVIRAQGLGLWLPPYMVYGYRPQSTLLEVAPLIRVSRDIVGCLSGSCPGVFGHIFKATLAIHAQQA